MYEIILLADRSLVQHFIVLYSTSSYLVLPNPKSTQNKPHAATIIFIIPPANKKKNTTHTLLYIN